MPATTIKYYLKTSYVAQYNVNETTIFNNVNRFLIEFSGKKSFRYIGRSNYPLHEHVTKGCICIPTDEVDKLIAKCRLLSATLSPYIRKDKLVLITPFDDEEGCNGTYQIVRSKDNIISIYWHNDMSLANWSHIYGEEEIHSYDMTLSKRITNVMEAYKKIFDELLKKYSKR